MTQKQTKRIILISILSTISLICMQFLQFPLWTGPFMKVDMSIVPILIGSFVLGLPSAFSILLIRSALKLILFPEGVGTLIGLPMNIVAMGILIWFVCFFMRKVERFDMKKYLVGSAFGTLVYTGVMVVLNYVYALPLYAKFAGFQLEQAGFTLFDWIIKMTIPFNLAQGVILTISALILIIPLDQFIQKQKKKFS